MKRPREPVFAKRSSPVMSSACHWVKFAESANAAVRTLTPLGHRPGGMHPDDIEPLADPMLRGAHPQPGGVRGCVQAMISRGSIGPAVPLLRCGSRRTSDHLVAASR